MSAVLTYTELPASPPHPQQQHLDDQSENCDKRAGYR
jgi:hypothetical protein